MNNLPVNLQTNNIDEYCDNIIKMNLFGHFSKIYALYVKRLFAEGKIELMPYEQSNE